MIKWRQPDTLKTSVANIRRNKPNIQYTLKTSVANIRRNIPNKEQAKTTKTSLFIFTM